MSIKNKELRIKNLENKILIKVHNSIKKGDRVEIVRPEYDILKVDVDKLYDSDTGEEISEAHGGQGRTVLLAVDEEVLERSVIRRLLK